MPTRWQMGDAARQALSEAERVANLRLVRQALEMVRIREEGEDEKHHVEEAVLSQAADVAEIMCLDLLSQDQSTEEYTQEAKQACETAFKILRWMSLPTQANDQLKHILRVACLGILAERTADTKRWLGELDDLSLSTESATWADRVFTHVATSFLKDIRQRGWDDLDSVVANVRDLRSAQAEYEETYLSSFGETAPRAAVELVALYHWAKSAELVSQFLAQGTPADVEAQLQFHFNRSHEAVSAGWIGELGTLIFLTHHAASVMIARSVWRSVRPLGERFVQFLERVVDRDNLDPIFELLPPQKRALEMRLMDIAQRAVVIQMPTSSGKTLLAEFRILQAKQAFANAMAVYLVPTRALVNQVTVRLRQELAPLGLTIEQAAPAFELDPTEEEFLLSPQAFDVLVTTPEKMDLLTRSGRLAEIGRPLGLVIVDEAHNIGADARGLRTEILLATISSEFPDARFLLLSPFVPNVEELGRWLGDNRNVSLSVEWRPNEKLIGICTPQGRSRNWDIQVDSLFTPQRMQTVDLSEPAKLETDSVRPTIDKPISRLNKRDIAAATTAVLARRGNVLVMTADQTEAHSLIQEVEDLLPSSNGSSEDIDLVQRFVSNELGDDFLLTRLLGNGLAFHHAGLSPEARFLIEWLMAKGELKVLAATTTLAQGVNFPVSSVVLTSHTQHRGPGLGRRPMPVDQFWNIAGRSGRLNQDLLGLALFVAKNSEDRKVIQDYVYQEIEALASFLERMVDQTLEAGKELNLELLVRYPEWSTFTQFIAHAYRVADRPTDFAARTETLLQSTLGYQRLRSMRPQIAQTLLQATRNYVGSLQNMEPGLLASVDQTGFSPRTIQMLFAQGPTIRRNLNDWSPSGLFTSESRALRELIGVLLKVNELRFDTEEGGYGTNIGRIVASWVRGISVAEIAKEYFPDDDPTKTVTECCRRLFGNILPNATWGFGALQTLGVDEDQLRNMPLAQQLEIRSVPAMLLYGVDTLDGVVMRNLNVPRLMAKPMGERFSQEVRQLEGRLSLAKQWLNDQPAAAWQEVVPSESQLSGAEYRRVWTILNGLE